MISLYMIYYHFVHSVIPMISNDYATNTSYNYDKYLSANANKLNRYWDTVWVAKHINIKYGM